MMLLKGFILMAAMTVLIPLSSGNTCSSQFPHSISAGGKCQLNCGSQKCICSDEASNISAAFNGCLQTCSRSPSGVNATVTSCPDMRCTNLDTCFQVCRTDSCSMECKAKKTCNQECGNGCTKAVCTAEKCHQQCINCTMECTSETKSCSHLCLGGTCHSKCAAQTCDRKCTSGAADCKVLYSSSSKHTLAAGLTLVIFVAYFFA